MTIKNLYYAAQLGLGLAQIRLTRSFGFVTSLGPLITRHPLTIPCGEPPSDRLRITLIKILAGICITASVSSGIFTAAGEKGVDQEGLRGSGRDKG